ncbi:hypothetical protein [Acholeplasma granularum]|uniref:hypothetical protein n=1 Tax=Acholeplasma granularum TaxID=264635 RepID=UPI00046FF986|nr:hypothetical protein [Acholeplasma granularum]
MSNFYIHFFKEKNRSLDMVEVIDFFESLEGFEIEMDEKSVRFIYTHPKLGYPCAFYITPKSKVPNIQRLSPQYLEVNFHLELPILSPNYFVKSIIQLVKKICDRFNFYVLSEMFEDVLVFNAERIFRVYRMVKKAYLEKYPEKENDYQFIKEDKLSDILRYIDEKDGLQRYYDDLNTLVPKYYFLKDEQNISYIATEWKEHDTIVFPPHLDYILFHGEQGIVKVIDYKLFLNKFGKYLLDVPGFLQDTKVIPPKLSKKLNRKVKKYKWEPVSKNFTKQNLHVLMDI